MSTWTRLARDVARGLGRTAVRQAPRLARRVRAARPAPPAGSSVRPGRELSYAPQPDGRADPGEVVWTWVAYEEQDGRGKDRPVLVVGRDGELLLGLMLSSRPEHDGEPHWLALGPGAWDREERASWVRLDRVLQVAETGIRREGAVLDRRRFDLVADRLRLSYGWG